MFDYVAFIGQLIFASFIAFILLVTTSVIGLYLCSLYSGG